MNPALIFQVLIPLLTEMPSIASGVEALISAVGAMVKSGVNAEEVAGAVKQAVPDITAAIIANTPHASGAPAS